MLLLLRQIKTEKVRCSVGSKRVACKGVLHVRSLHLACNIQGTVFSAKSGIRIHRYLIQKEPAKSVTAGLLTFKIKVLAKVA